MRHSLSPRLDAIPSCLDAEKLDRGVWNEGCEHPDGIATSANARDDCIRELSRLLQHLFPALSPNDRLEISHDGGERVGTDGAPDNVVRRAHVGDPVAQRLVHRVLQGAAPGLNATDFSAQNAHPEDVQLLPLHVHLTHVNDTGHAEESARRRCRDAMLPGPSLRNDPCLAQLLCEQSLSQSVVDLVRTGVGEILALEPDAGAAAVLGEPLRVVERSRTTDVVAAERLELGLEFGVFGAPYVLFLELPGRVSEGQWIWGKRHMRQ